jgi:sigma-B regulation protein RsbU (phosphoserine phosphatase)
MGPLKSVSGGSLLVVDDDEYNRDMLSRRLQKAGYTVAVAENGTRALAMVAASDFDLILLDVMMHGVSGLEVLEHLRKSSAAIDLPVIMATAKAQSVDVVEALRLGANDYVTKPLDFPVVLARVETHVSMKRATDRIRRLERSLEEQNRALEGANVRMARDLRAAANVQASLLPHKVPDIAGLQFSWTFRPCEELAGDALGIVRLDATHVGLYVLDVSGHGAASALLSVSVARFLSPATDPGSILVRRADDGGEPRPVPPAEVADRLNVLFPYDESTGQYFTLSYGVLNAVTGEYRFASAGHPGPVHAPLAGRPRFLEGRGFPIGLAEDAYQEERIMLGPGDRLFLYSDAVHETASAQGEMFGGERLLRTVERTRIDPLSSAVSTLRADVESWSEGVGLLDDLTILGVEWLTINSER